MGGQKRGQTPTLLARGWLARAPLPCVAKRVERPREEHESFVLGPYIVGVRVKKLHFDCWVNVVPDSPEET